MNTNYKQKLASCLKRGKALLISSALIAGAITSGNGQNLISADFTGQTLPTGWDTVNISGAMNYYSESMNWAFDNPGFWIINNGSGTNFDGDFAIFDSDYWGGVGGSVSEEAALVTPAFDASGNGVYIILQFDNSFQNYAYGNSEAHVEVWDGSIWNDVLTMTGTDDGYPDANHKTIDITSACGGSTAAKVRFRWANGDYDYYWAVDNVSINKTSCLGPGGLVASAITSSSAIVSWNAPSTVPGNGYEYYYSTSNTMPSASVSPSGATIDTFTNLSSLSPGTNYYVWVRSSCSASNTGSWIGPLIIFTTCVGYIPPYQEGFESNYVDGNPLSGCITQEGVSGSTEWIANNSFVDYNRGPASGSWNAFLQYGNERWLFIPVQLTGGTSYTISLFARQDGSGSTNATISLSYGISDNDAAMTNTIVVDNGLTNGSYQKITGDFVPSTSGTYYVGIKGNINFSPWYISIDDVSIMETPTCIEPLQLSVSGISFNSANVSWSPATPIPGNGYEYCYSTSATPPTANTAPDGSSTDTFATINNLSPNTQYYVWVRSVCSATEKSIWSIATSFTTLCLPQNVPYVAPIQVATAPGIPDCMITELLNPNGTNWFLKDNNSNNYGFSGKYLQCSYTAFGDGAMNSWIYTNQLNLQANTIYKLSFRYGNNSTNYSEKLAAVIGTAPVADSMTTVVFDDTNISMNGSLDTNIYFTVPADGSYTIGFHGHSDEDEYNLFLSDISVDTIPPCPNPLSVNATNATATTVDVSWIGNSQKYLIEYGPSGFSLGTGTKVLATLSPYTINNIAPNDTYDVYVRGVCIPGIDSSGWSLPATFTTLCSVPVINLGNDTNLCTGGGTLTIYSGNANPNASIVWSDGSTDDTLVVSTTGDYFATVTDQYGCSASDTVNIGLHQNPDSVDLGADTAFCGGDAVVLYSGNTSVNYNVLWSDGSTGDNLTVFSTGDYWATVTTQFGCKATDTVSVTVYPAISVDLGNDTSFCDGGVAVLNVSNVSANQTILWSDGSAGNTLDATNTGIYYVTVTTAEGCEAKDTVLVTVYNNPELDLGIDTAICEGTGITLQLNNLNASDTILWNDGSQGDHLFVNTGGFYFVTVTTQNGCQSSDSITVTENLLPNIVGITGTIQNDNSYTFTATGVTDGTDYLWDFGDGTTSTAVSPNHTFPSSGNYTVVLTVSNDCGSDTSAVDVYFSETGVSRLDIEESQLTLFPNPARNLITLKNESKQQMRSITVYNILGQEVIRLGNIDGNQYQLNVSALASGMYNLKVVFQNEKVAMRRFEIRK